MSDPKGVDALAAAVVASVPTALASAAIPIEVAAMASEPDGEG